ncbi:CBO0543 family protein [Neobacillus sp. PS2-9]|uniref:CBO0543 family protein n=1 Tax=Neobacillus sp. PS2-9 TaxID=3070676 RepID=UPI0035A90E51
MLSFYINLLGVNRGLWSYPFQLIPTMPSFAFDSSFVPVTFMLVYQWTLHHKKNIIKRH